MDDRGNLSGQVHPNDALPKGRRGSFGRMEMWHILKNDPNAELILGFNKELDKEEYIEKLEMAQ
jgi:mannose-6-phosphate isomerase